MYDESSLPWCGILCPGVREVQDKGKLLEVMRLGPMLPAGSVHNELKRGKKVHFVRNSK